MLTEIVSPKEIIFSEEIAFIIVPSVEGDIGVLNKHTPVITTLRAGLIYVYKNNSIYKKFYTKGGICEITEDKCIILTEEIEDVKEIDLNEIKNQLEQSEELKNKINVIENQFYN